MNEPINGNNHQLFERTWEEYIGPIKRKIENRAIEIAKADDGRTEVTSGDAIDALREFVPGKPVNPSPPEPRQNWLSRTFTGFTGIVAFMTLAFGALGALGLFATNPEVVKATQGFLEIAKIFAGAVIGGSVGAAAVKRSS
ncbi:MAG TPA: hypothetical protein VK591_02095 [Xanthobacteraceae bacterium]|nr:hypothetical protein [Xanthobacteraceae bacterium]